MGKVGRWFKSLFGTTKSRERLRHDEPPRFSTDTRKEHNKNTNAVSPATVVGLTGGGRVGDMITREERLAAVTIQKVFRGSLARKALRALKGIVKLQALVRGFLVRKRAAAMLESIQTLIRLQTAVLSKRSNRSSNQTFRSRHSIDKFDEGADDERSKIVEMGDMLKRRSKSRQVHNMSECGDDFVYHGNEMGKRKFATTNNTPRLTFSSHHHAGNNRYYATQTPAKNDCGNTLCDCEMSSPGYMEKTQSFKAKLRSHSAPRQRSERKRLSLDEVMASRGSEPGLNMVQPQRYSYSYSPY